MEPSQELKDELETIVGSRWLVTEPEQMRDYLLDETPDPVAPEPCEDVVLVKPADSEEISAVLQLASRREVRVIPRGAGTGLCGAAVPLKPGIILSLERLNEVLELDKDNMFVRCQAGLSLEKLFESLEGTGLFFPPHPGDEGAQIGGLVAENAGGARAVKYGVVRNYVKGLRVVLPSGERMDWGGKTLKDNSGYPLLQLLVGSEGTLAIITEVTLRLYPEPKSSATLLLPYEERKEAIESVSKLLRGGADPLAIEYVEREHVEESARHLGENWPSREGEVYLILIFASESEEALYRDCERVASTCERDLAGEMLIAEREKDQRKILDVRSNLYSTYQDRMAEDLDIAVPPARMAEMMDKVEEIAEDFSLSVPTWGHAGDGNLHLHIMKREGEVPSELEEVKEKIYGVALELGGTITGEHGVGLVRSEDLPLLFTEAELDLMKRLKTVFDPQGILNPGKIYPN